MTGTVCRPHPQKTSLPGCLVDTWCATVQGLLSQPSPDRCSPSLMGENASAATNTAHCDKCSQNPQAHSGETKRHHWSSDEKLRSSKHLLFIERGQLGAVLASSSSSRKRLPTIRHSLSFRNERPCRSERCTQTYLSSASGNSDPKEMVTKYLHYHCHTNHTPHTYQTTTKNTTHHSLPLPTRSTRLPSNEKNMSASVTTRVAPSLQSHENISVRFTFPNDVCALRSLFLQTLAPTPPPDVCVFFPSVKLRVSFDPSSHV